MSQGPGVAVAGPPDRGGLETHAGLSRARLSGLLASSLFAARFAPIWLATAVLLVVTEIIAPEALSSSSLTALLPLMTFVAIAALGEMLVVMTGGIDLSMAGLITFVGSLLVGVSHGSDSRLGISIAICLGWAAVAGLANGLLVGMIGLNPLIVTLATGQILYGITEQYRLGTANESGVPPSFSNFTAHEFLGLNWIFWIGVLLTLALAFALRYTRAGRRFQSVGANQQAAWVAGLHVRSYVVMAYVLCSLLGGVAAILLSGFIQNPQITLGDPYLLGPVAAVVIAGASLLGGLASSTSTWVAAFALTLLNQVLRVLGLTSALQFIVYGIAIIVGMVISGDRIADLFGKLLLRRGTRALLGDELQVPGSGAEPSSAGQVDPAMSLTGTALQHHLAAAATRAQSAASPAVLSLQGISKRFGAVQAVSDVSIDCYPGEVHAVVGENGSGKSTLLSVACGVVVPDTGRVEVGGRPLALGSTGEAIRLGIGMTYQTYSQVLELTVAENLLLSMPADERPAYHDMARWAADRLDEYGVDFDPGAPAASHTLAERQLLEVVKALLHQPKVLLLDEPTTALGPGEVDQLHALIRARAAAGVGVVYVSHRLPEVLGLASRVTVLRDGRSQGTFDSAGLSEESLVGLMIGRPLQLAFPPTSQDGHVDAVTLEISQLRGPQFGPIDLRLRPGEILGLAGAEGNGQDRLIRSLAGVERAAGNVRRNGSKIELRTPGAAVRAGIALLSGDRSRESLFPVLSIRANATIQVLRRFSRFGLLMRRKERTNVLALARGLQVRAASVEQPVLFLSGGNQQKVALMRPFLRSSLRLILADEPTQGVDVRSRFDIYQALREKASSGATVIIKSSDPLELSGLCDRVLVMSRGQVIDEIPAAELTPAAGVGEKRIIEAIVGSKAATRSQRAPAAGEQPEPVVDDTRPKRGRRVRPSGLRGWMPLALMAGLLVAVGGYTASQSADFATSFNLNGLFIATVPLALVSMGQLNAMLVGGFDVSVGALMTACVVVSSFTMGLGEAWWQLLFGALAVVAVALGGGILNAGLIRIGRLPPIIATLATLSIFQGIALALRPVPNGQIDTGLVDALTKSVGPIPISLIGVVVLAVLWDIWLYRSAGGLTVRAVGLDATSARRSGARADHIFVRGFLLSALLAGVASFFLSAQIGIGDPTVGLPFALSSVAAAVLGGASLTGGRGSFVGVVLSSLFLFLILNILPFLNISTPYGDIAVGALTLIALSIYRGPELWARTRQAVSDLRAMRLANQ
jgi:ribose transport system ATP-binding protein